QDVHAVRAGERQAAGQQLVHHDADGIEVAAVIHFFTANLFRADVAGGADREIDVRVGHFAERLALHELRQSEVHNLDAFARRVRLHDHQVGGLQVAVNDAFIVRGLEHLAEFADDPADPCRVHSAVFSQ